MNWQAFHDIIVPMGWVWVRMKQDSANEQWGLHKPAFAGRNPLLLVTGHVEYGSLAEIIEKDLDGQAEQEMDG